MKTLRLMVVLIEISNWLRIVILPSCMEIELGPELQVVSGKINSELGPGFNEDCMGGKGRLCVVCVY